MQEGGWKKWLFKEQNNPRNRFSNFQITLEIIIGVSLLVIITILSIANLLPGGLVEAFSAFSTIALVYIYWRMRQDQFEVKQLHQDQVVLEKETKSPSLFVSEFWPNIPENSDPDEYYPVFRIKNLGNTPARYLQIKIEPELMVWKGSEEGLQPMEQDSGLESIERPLEKFNEVTKDEENGENRESGDDENEIIVDEKNLTGTSLDPGDEDTFKVKVDFPVKDQNAGYFSPSGEIDEPNPLRPYEMTVASAFIESNDLTGICPNNDYYDNGVGPWDDWGMGQMVEDEYEEGADDIPFHRLKLTISFKHLLSKEISKTHGEPSYSNFTVILPLNGIKEEKLDNKWESNKGYNTPMYNWSSENIWNWAEEEAEYETLELEALAAKRSDKIHDPEIDLIENKMLNGEKYK